MENAESEKRIEQELVETLYDDLRVSLIASLLVAFIFVYGMWEEGGGSKSLLWWTMAMIVVTAIRLFEISRYRKQRKKSETDIKKWKIRFRFFLTIASLLWGSGIFFFFPGDSPLYQAYTIFIVAGVTAGGVNSLSADRWASIIFPTNILLALFFRLMLESERIYFMEAVMSLIYLILLIYIAYRFHYNQEETLRNYFRSQETSDRLAESQNRLTFLFDSVPAAIFYYDRECRLIEGNRLFESYINLMRETEEPVDLRSVAPAQMLPALERALTHPHRQSEEDLKLGDGHSARWVHLQATALVNRQKKVVGGVGILTDITDHIRAMEAIRHRADYDQLTDLPNRSLLLEQLSASLKKLDRSLSSLALLFVDIDNFKEINDSYGHPMGDRILIETGRRLRHHLRWEDTLGRFGGDEFVIVLHNLPADMEGARERSLKVAENLLAALKEPVIIGNEKIRVTLSIGIALTQNPYQRPETLLTEADQAMYRAKHEGKNRVVIHQE